ncbi:hypothetical protein Tco_0175067 [Tanacetum coccineum]
MSGKSSPLKRLIIGTNVWVKLPEGENNFYPAMDSHASNPTPTDCMERVSCESLCPSRPEGRIPTCIANGVSTDGHEEDFFPEMESSGSVVVNVPGIVKD